MKLFSTLALSLATLSLAACAGEQASPDTANGGGSVGRSFLASEGAQCDVAADLGELGAMDASWAVKVDNAASSEFDLGNGWTLAIDLWTRGEDIGSYQVGIKDLAGESSYETCTTCVLLLNDNGIALLADGGDANIAELDHASEVGRMRGSLADVTFHQVAFDENGIVGPVEGGCTSRIDSAFFDVEVSNMSDDDLPPAPEGDDELPPIDEPWDGTTPDGSN